MSNEYPREEELKVIEEWDLIHNSVIDFLEYVRSLWKYEDRFVLKGKRVLRLYLSTGGWSGNEDIIVSLRKNPLFWYSWEKSTVGGHFWFRIDLKQSKHQKEIKDG